MENTVNSKKKSLKQSSNRGTVLFERLKAKRTFEAVFVLSVLGLVAVWLISLIFPGEINGVNQFKLFFRECRDFFADFANVAVYSKELDPYNCTIADPGEKAYLPLTYLIMYVYSKIVGPENCVNLYSWKNPQMMVLIALTWSFIGALFFLLIYKIKNGKNILKILVASVIMLSGMYMYAFERGNTIVLTAMLSLFFVFEYDSENKCVREISFIALALAAAFKATPALLGILLIYDKKWFCAVRLMVYGVICCVVPFFFLKGGLANIDIMRVNIEDNLDLYKDEPGIGLRNLFADLMSKFECLRWGRFARLGEHVLPTDVDSFTTPITYIGSGILLVSAMLQKRPWRRVLAVSLVLIMLPKHSGIYCAMYVLPAVIMFINEENHRYDDWLYLVCFVMLLNPFVFAEGDDKWTLLNNQSVYFGFMFVAMAVEGLICSVLHIFDNAELLINRRRVRSEKKEKKKETDKRGREKTDE